MYCQQMFDPFLCWLVREHLLTNCVERFDEGVEVEGVLGGMGRKNEIKVWFGPAL